MKNIINAIRNMHQKAQGHGDTSFADSLLTPQYPNQIEMNRQMFKEGGDPKPIEYTYKDKATWLYNNLQDTFTNDERQDKRKERRKTRKKQRQGQRDIATTGPEGSPRMSQPQFKQDRQAVFDENVEAFEKKASRKAKAEGGLLLADDREQYGLGALVKSISKNLIKKDSKGKIINISEAKKELKKLKDDLKEKKEVATTGQELDEVELLEEAVDDIQADIIKTTENVHDDYSARGMVAEGGEIDDQMESLMNEEETHTMPDGTEMEGATHGQYEEQMEGLMDTETPMLPDEEMEEDYVDYVIEETLSDEDKNYLISALEQDDRLSEIVDQVVESATEFSGSGPIEGPGSEMSDSIPARLSDGEFVFTAKAVEEIGSDNLMSMMKEAEASAEQRQGVAYGGMIDEEDRAIPLPTQGSRAAMGQVPNVIKQPRQVEEEMLKSSPRRYYVPVSG